MDCVSVSDGRQRRGEGENENALRTSLISELKSPVAAGKCGNVKSVRRKKHLSVIPTEIPSAVLNATASTDSHTNIYCWNCLHHILLCCSGIIASILSANRERSGKITNKHSSSDVDRMFVQSNLVLNIVLKAWTKTWFMHHSWNVLIGLHFCPTFAVFSNC